MLGQDSEMKNSTKRACHIFICGCHSVGKTTLVNELSKRSTFSSYKVGPEVARTIMNERGWTKENFDLESHRDNFKILNLAIVEECEKMLQECQGIDTLFDRGPDALIYIRYYLSEQEYQQTIAKEGTRYCIERYRQGIAFVVEPCKEFIVEDSARIASTFEQRQEFTKLMCKTLDELRIPYYVISDKDLNKRVQIVTECTAGHRRGECRQPEF